MVVKSETSGCKWCINVKKFWSDLKNDETYAIVSTIGTLILITGLYFGYVRYIEVSDKSSKYEEIMADKPILQCGDQIEIKSSNYKVVLVDENPLVKVFYSDTKVITYELKECSVIKEMFNAELGVENVEFVNAELKTTITRLKSKIKDGKTIISNKDSQIAKLVETNKQIKKDYNLPTQKQLDTHYNGYIASKKKDIKDYLLGLKKAEKIALAKARAENPKQSVDVNDCYEEELMADPEIYTLWIAGKCDEINWRLKNGKLKPKKQDADINEDIFSSAPSEIEYIAKKNKSGGTYYEKK